MPEVAAELARVQTPDEFKKVIQSNPGRFARTKRKQLFIDELDIRFAMDIDKYQGQGSGGGGNRGYGGGGGGVSLAGGGGGGRVGLAGGGGGFQAAPVGGDEDGEESEGGPGFYIFIKGRMLFGETNSNAAKLITEEYYPRLKQLGSRSGLGFYLPESDARSNDKQNLQAPTIVKNFLQNQGNQFNPFGTPVRAEPTGDDGVPEQFKDPVTEEDVRSDWSFEFGFKIKLGQAPVPEGEEDEAG
jgi:hypothetical protein